MAVHAGGGPLEIDHLVDEAHKRGVQVIENCSQAPGAVWKGRRVGVFGDIAAFSTMYRKTLTAGASGGLVYTKDVNLHCRALAHADRGKQVWRTDINQNDPGHALLPALNFNTDELSCAIGLSSIARLQDAIDSRNAVVQALVERLERETNTCRPYDYHDGFSPFYFPIFVDTSGLYCSKIEFAQAVQAEGIDLNLHFGCVITDWEWAKPYLSDDFVTPNAIKTRDESFNLFLNEQYRGQEVDDILSAICKVEDHSLRT